jgi:hypothetical protein
MKKLWTAFWVINWVTLVILIMFEGYHLYGSENKPVFNITSFLTFSIVAYGFYKGMTSVSKDHLDKVQKLKKLRTEEQNMTKDAYINSEELEDAGYGIYGLMGYGGMLMSLGGILLSYYCLFGGQISFIKNLTNFGF